MSSSRPGRARAIAEKRRARARHLSQLEAKVGFDLLAASPPEPEFGVRVSFDGSPFRYVTESPADDEPDEPLELSDALSVESAIKAAHGGRVESQIQATVMYRGEPVTFDPYKYMPHLDTIVEPVKEPGP